MRRTSAVTAYPIDVGQFGGSTDAVPGMLMPIGQDDLLTLQHRYLTC